MDRAKEDERRHNFHLHVEKIDEEIGQCRNTDSHYKIFQSQNVLSSQLSENRW